MNFFRKLFGKKEKQEQKLIIEIPENKLKQWLNEELKGLDENEIKKQYNEILQTTEEIKSSISDLEAAVFEENVDKRLFEASTRARSLLIRKLGSSLEKVNQPSSFNFNALVEFHNSLLREMVSIVNAWNAHSYLINPLFRKEMHELNNRIKKLGQLIDELGGFIEKNRDYGEKFNELNSIAEDFNNISKKIISTRLEIEGSYSKVKELQTDIDAKQKEMLSLSDSEATRKAQALQSEVEQLRNEKQRLESEILQELSSIGKPLKKYNKMADSEEISVPKESKLFLKDYAKDPLLALSDEKNLPVLKAVLKHTEELIKENRIDLKDKKRDRALSQIKNIIDNDVLASRINAYRGLSERIEAKLKIDNSFEIFKKMKEFEFKINSLEQELLKDRERLKELEDDIKAQEELKKGRKEKLEGVISELTGKEIKII
ncbi:MAG: hypothetical protein HY929_07855 [Euryarchaeota archaeon]|nr:hypothetical protein [Euryarchaeota archaeon]